MRIGPETGHNRWHPDLEPVASVRPGQEVVFETRDGIDGQLTRASTHESIRTLSLGRGHPLTGPVWVEGAEPGDVLVAELLAYESGDFGVNGAFPGFGFLADQFTEPFLVKWEIDGQKARAAELPGVAVPGDPFAGVIGVAPSHELMANWKSRELQVRAEGGPVAPDLPEEAYPPAAEYGMRTIPPRENGGNLDVKQLVAGSRIFLPVFVPGALFSIGDLHFAQGDGEVSGTGIEMEGAVAVRFALRKSVQRQPRFPVFETPARPQKASFATTGIAIDAPMDVDEAAREALVAMLDHLEHERGLARPAAYALCSACVDLRISEVVDIPYPLVSALLPLDVFED